jgi:hypothetical protein
MRRKLEDIWAQILASETEDNQNQQGGNYEKILFDG